MSDQTPDPLRTRLHEAAVEGDAARVEAALRAGCTVDAQDREGNTALFFAAANRNIATLRALLEAGADTEVANRWGNTALTAATYSSRGDGEFIHALLEFGADPDHPNKTGKTPRMLAEMIANFDVKRFFS